MAPNPHLYSNYTFTSDFAEFHPQGLVSSLNGNNTMLGGQDGLGPVLDNGALDQILSSTSLDCDAISSGWIPNYSEQLGGISDMVIPAISDCKMGFFGGGGITGYQNFNSRYQQPHVGEFGEECCGFVEETKPTPYPNAARESWGNQCNQLPAVEEPNIKVGRYSEEERKERILRYLKKRNQRNFNKTIKYACRKTLADRRVRVRGRFARNNEMCDEETAAKKHENHHHTEDFYGGESFQFQLKNEDEDWLQEALASLVYLSHSSPDDI